MRRWRAMMPPLAHRRWRGPKIAALMYHDVTDTPEASGFPTAAAQPYKHDIQAFEQQLEQIVKAEAKIATVDEIDFQSPQPVVLLTFDDGGQSAGHIADRLETHGWRGHFFVVTKRLNTPGFLSGSNLADLHSRGHVVGSHSHTHPDIFYRLSFEQMLAEWRTSLDVLQSILQAPVTCASIPGGDMDAKTQRSAEAAGIRFLFTSEPTYRPWSVGRMQCLGRVCVKRMDSVDRTQQLVRFRGYAAEMGIRKTKNMLKKVFYPYYVRRIDAASHVCQPHER